MSVVQTLIGNIKGPKGDTGSTGSTGAQGPAATITVGSTTTTAYGNSASVTNVGTTSAAILNFVIPQGKPGEKTTKIGELVLDSITTSQADFPSPQVDDTGATAFGKIVKFFSDTLTRFSKHAGNVATISSSPTTQPFSIGDYLVYNDQLYKVTANIASGGTLTPGTNISSTSTGAQLTSLNAALQSFKCLLIEQFSLTTTAKSWDIPENTVCMVLLVSGDNTAASGLWFFRTGTASIQPLQISKGTDVTFNTSGLSFSLAKTSSSRTSTILIYQLSNTI